MKGESAATGELVGAGETGSGAAVQLACSLQANWTINKGRRKFVVFNFRLVFLFDDVR